MSSLSLQLGRRELNWVNDPDLRWLPLRLRRLHWSASQKHSACGRLTLPAPTTRLIGKIGDRPAVSSVAALDSNVENNLEPEDGASVNAALDLSESTSSCGDTEPTLLDLDERLGLEVKEPPHASSSRASSATVDAQAHDGADTRVCGAIGSDHAAEPPPSLPTQSTPPSIQPPLHTPARFESNHHQLLSETQHLLSVGASNELSRNVQPCILEVGSPACTAGAQGCPGGRRHCPLPGCYRSYGNSYSNKLAEHLRDTRSTCPRCGMWLSRKTKWYLERHLRGGCKAASITEEIAKRDIEQV